MRTVLLFCCSAVLLFFIACGAAPGRLLLNDDAGVLDAVEITNAAAPLVERDAIVAVYTSEEGDATGAQFAGWLNDDGLLANDQVIPDAIAVYVSFSPRYSELRIGSRWNDTLPNDALEAIRAEQLNPELRAGRATAGIAAVLGAIEERVSGGWGRLVLYGFGALVIVVLGYIFLLDPLDRAVRGAWRRWAATPLGQWFVRGWEAMPIGAALTRRARIRAATLARTQLRWRIAAAQSDAAIWLKDLESDLHASCMARIAALDARAAALAAQPDATPGLADALNTLAAEYSATADLTRVCWQVQGRAQNAAARVAQIAHLADTVADGGTTARKGKRQQKKARTQPSAIVAQLTALNEELAALMPQIQSATRIAPRLNDLTTRYNTLHVAAYELWKKRCPEEYAAEMQRIRKAQAEQSRRTAETSAAGATAYESYSSTSSTSSSDNWSSSSSDSSSSSSSSSSESRAGGDW